MSAPGRFTPEPQSDGIVSVTIPVNPDAEIIMTRDHIDGTRTVKRYPFRDSLVKRDEGEPNDGGEDGAHDPS